jgi:hypothetical protein
MQPAIICLENKGDWFFLYKYLVVKNGVNCVLGIFEPKIIFFL